MPKAKEQDNMQQSSIKTAIIQAALDCAATKGWAATSLNDIADAADIELHELCAEFADKSDILSELGRMIDRQVLENIGKAETDMPPRDRLFDIMMERFDVLNDYRDGLCAVLDSFRLDPKQAVIGLPHLGRSMNWMLEAAQIDTSGIKGAARVFGLTAIYLDTLRTWKKDDSPDMGKTMAALDKNMERAEGFANMCRDRKLPDMDIVKNYATK